MSKRKKYYWRGEDGKIKSSWGIELTKAEQAALCRKNLQLIQEQLKK